MTISTHSDDPDSDDPVEPGDDVLITRVRGGDRDAFAVLYRRHVDAARRCATALATRSSDRDDLVAEAFTAVLAALSAGGGPDVAFRAYLLVTVRNCFYRQCRTTAKLTVVDDVDSLLPGVVDEDTVLAGLERQMIARAYAQLPERWQAVLWHTEVEGDTPAELAPLLGLSANGAAALAYRAREAFRQAYLQAHLQADPAAGPYPSDCAQTRARLGSWARDGLGKRERARVGQHLAGCGQCRTIATELAQLNTGLRNILAPALLGGSWSAYLHHNPSPPRDHLSRWRRARRRAAHLPQWVVRRWRRTLRAGQRARRDGRRRERRR